MFGYGGKLVVLVLCFGFSSLLVHAQAYAHTASVTTSGTVTMDVAASGTKASISSDEVIVNSTCPLGYTLSIGGPSDNALYRNGNSASTGKINPSAGTVANPLPIVGDDGSGNSYLGTWGYTTTANPTINSNFIGLTSTATTLMTKSTASATGGDRLLVSYGVSVTDLTEAGAYTLAESTTGANDNVITYYLTTSAECNNYTIKYNDNGANSTTTMTGMTHSITSSTTSINLAPSNYQRAGYGFAGWSTEQLNPDASDFNTKLATAQANNHVYGPMETVTINQTLLDQATIINSQQTITMYAIWVPSQGSIQAWTGCESMSQGQVTALTDTRDNSTYAVAKLADNKCWMIENLRLNHQYTTGQTNIAKAQGYAGVFTGLANAETANFADSTTANSLYSIDGSTINTISGDNLGYRFPRYRNSNTASPVNNMTTSNANIYSYGNYYTWPAALANTNNYTSPTATVDGKTSETVGTSICPLGWQLPYGRNTGNGNTPGDRKSVVRERV